MKEGWTYKKLGEVASFSRGLTYSKGDVAVDSSKKVLRSNNIDLATHSLNFDDVACLKEEFVIPVEKMLQQNDIFICMSNGSTQHLGKVAFIDKKMDYAFGGFMGAVHPKVNDIFPKYAFYFCLSSEYRRLLASVLNGININNLKWSDLSKFPIPIPPLSEQQRIVNELDLLSSIIEKKKAQLKEYDQLAQSIFYDMFGDPVSNEKGWEAKKLGEVYKLKSGDSLSAKQFVDGQYPVYGGNGISGYHNAFNMEGNYIIIGRVGAYCGNVRNVIGKFWLTDNAFQLIYDVEQQNPIFVTYVLTYLDLHQYANHAAQPVISNITLKEIIIPYPPLTLQQSFASKIEAIERQKALIQQSITEAETLFDSRMDFWFS